MSPCIPTGFAPSQPFTPARGMRSAHVQTIYGAYFRTRTRRPVQRRRWELPDGDFLEVDILRARRSAPYMLLLHGLEASSRAGYVRAMLHAASSRDWGAVAMNFRSCGGEMNRLPRLYCAGDIWDVAQVMSRLRAMTSGPLFGVGYSFGASVLLSHLADEGSRSPLLAAVAISTPYDLTESVRHLDRGAGWTRVYRDRFLRSLRAKALEKARRFPGQIDPQVRQVTSIETYDQMVTAPLHGFASAGDYYRQCSSGPRLGAVNRPTLLLSAADDPLVPYAGQKWGTNNPWLTNVITERGGHAAFVSGQFHKPEFWADEQTLHFLEFTLAQSRSNRSQPGPPTRNAT